MAPTGEGGGGGAGKRAGGRDRVAERGSGK